MSTPNLRAARRIRSNASRRSPSDASLTWSNRAIALRTCDASLRGSLRSRGNAYSLSGIALRSSASSSCPFAMPSAYPRTRGSTTRMRNPPTARPPASADRCDFEAVRSRVSLGQQAIVPLRHGVVRAVARLGFDQVAQVVRPAQPPPALAAVHGDRERNVAALVAGGQFTPERVQHGPDGHRQGGQLCGLL